MTGMFELFIDEGTRFRFRLKAPDGTVVAVSRSFPDKRAAVSGIRDVREYAGMGLITDLCPEVPFHGTSTAPRDRGDRQIDSLEDTYRSNTVEPLPLAAARTDMGGGDHRAGPIDRHLRRSSRLTWVVRGHADLRGQRGKHALNH